jgi:hypothetical protein
LINAAEAAPDRNAHDPPKRFPRAGNVDRP